MSIATASATSTAASTTTTGSASAAKTGSTAASETGTSTASKASTAESTSAVEATGLSTDSNGNVQTILSLITPPAWTETSWSAYYAPGTNTTVEPHSSTSSGPPLFPGLEKTTTTNTHTSTTHTAAWAWATAQGIPKNELTRCQIDGKNDTWGPFCSPDHNQPLWVGNLYACEWHCALLRRSG